MGTVMEAVPSWISATSSVCALVVALAALSLASRRLRQDVELKRDWETVAVVSRYSGDPVIQSAEKMVFEVMAEFGDDEIEVGIRDCRREIRVVLNYLDLIAYGVRSGFYNREIVSQHLGSVVSSYVDDFIFKYEIGTVQDYRELVQFSQDLSSRASAETSRFACADI